MEFNMIVCPENYKSADLSNYTDKINQIILKGNNVLEKCARDISVILAKIGEGQLYKEDGFKSVAEYAMHSFGIKKSTAYMLYRAGKIYLDSSVCDTAKKFTPSKLAELSTLDTSILNNICDSGIVTCDNSQMEIRNWVSDYKSREIIDDTDSSESHDEQKKCASILYGAMGFSSDNWYVPATKITEDEIGQDIQENVTILAERIIPYSIGKRKSPIHLLVLVKGSDIFSPAVFIYYPLAIEHEISDILRRKLFDK